MTLVFPEDPGETEPEANPQHEGGDADVQDIDHRPDLTVHDGGDEGSVSVDDRRGPSVTMTLGEFEDREMVYGSGGGGPLGIAASSTLTLVYSTRDGQEVRLDLDQESVGAEDFETALEAFERTVRYLVAESAVRGAEE